MAIPLELRAFITAQGLEVFGQLQGGIAGVSSSAQQAATAGLQQLSGNLASLLPLVGGDLQLAIGGAVSAMRTLEQSGRTNSSVLAELANSLDRARASFTQSIPKYEELIRQGHGYQTILAELNPGQRAFIADLEDARDRLFRLSVGMKQAEGAAVKLGGAQKGAAAATKFLGREARASALTGMNVLSSATQGVMMGMGALQGSVTSVGFGLVFLRYAIAPIVLGIAALTAALGGIVKIAQGITRSITSLGNTFDEFAFKVQQSGAVIASTGQIWRLALGWAEKAARPIDEVKDALNALAEAKILKENVIGAMFEYAAKTGKPAVEVAKLFGEAIGMAKADPEALKKLGVAWEDITDAANRGAVTMALVEAVTKRTGGAMEARAATISGGMDRIRAAWDGVKATFAQPIWNEILTPLVDLLSKAAVGVRKMAQEVWESDAVQTEWNRTLKLGRDVIDWLTAAYKENEELIRFVLEKALTGVLAVFRGLLWVVKTVATVLVGLTWAWQALGRILKPVWDGLRLVARFLKPVGDILLSVSRPLKSFVDLVLDLVGAEPDTKWVDKIGELEGPLSSLEPLLGIVANILDEFEPLKIMMQGIADALDPVWENWRRTARPALDALSEAIDNLKKAIFGFEGAGPILINWSRIVAFLFIPWGAALTFILGKILHWFTAAAATIANSVAVMIEYFTAWARAVEGFITVMQGLRELDLGQVLVGVGKLMAAGEDIVTKPFEVWEELITGGFNTLKESAIGGWPELMEYMKGVPDLWEEMERATQPPLPPLGLPSPSYFIPPGQGGIGGRAFQIGLGRTGAAPVTVNINVTGNTILNEDDARRLADRINRVTMGNMTGRYGMQLARVG